MNDGTSRIELDCGIAHERIRAWLEDELALDEASGAYAYLEDGSRCRVEIRALDPRAFGSISLERTSLVVSGENRAVASFRRLFELRFVSAGG